MCGIVGYAGTEQAAPILLDGLERLEYRGYDSAGIAVLSEEKGLQLRKTKGRLKVLSALVDGGKALEGHRVVTVASVFSGVGKVGHGISAAVDQGQGEAGVPRGDHGENAAGKIGAAEDKNMFGHREPPRLTDRPVWL